MRNGSTYTEIRTFPCGDVNSETLRQVIELLR